LTRQPNSLEATARYGKKGGAKGRLTPDSKSKEKMPLLFVPPVFGMTGLIRVMLKTIGSMLTIFNYK
jgi:hypothetical protein